MASSCAASRGEYSASSARNSGVDMLDVRLKKYVEARRRTLPERSSATTVFWNVAGSGLPVTAAISARCWVIPASNACLTWSAEISSKGGSSKGRVEGSSNGFASSSASILTSAAAPWPAPPGEGSAAEEAEPVDIGLPSAIRTKGRGTHPRPGCAVHHNRVHPCRWSPEPWLPPRPGRASELPATTTAKRGTAKRGTAKRGTAGQQKRPGNRNGRGRTPKVRPRLS